MLNVRLNKSICLVSMRKMHKTQTSIFESFEKCIEWLLESAILPIAKDLANQFMGCTIIDFIVEEAVNEAPQFFHVTKCFLNN